MSQFVIETHNLTKVYGEQRSVSNLNIHVRKRLSYNKHNLRKARNNAAFTGYAYFIYL